MEPPSIRTYRSSFWTLWRWTSAFCGLLGACYYVMCYFSGCRPVHALPTAGLSLGLGTVFAAAVVCFPVYVSPEGLRCYNFWGVYQSIGWFEIERISPTNLFGLKYLRVFSHETPAEIWLPLYLTNLREFTDDVRQFAGADHSLVAALENYDG
jgi:hypothetical protein